MNTLSTILNLFLACSSAFISTIALFFTVKAFLLKNQSKVLGHIEFSFSNESEDFYIKNISLENIKKNPLVIYEIYLRLGYSYYLLLDDYKSEPLIVKPFELYQIELKPIVCYTIRPNRIDLNEQFKNRKVKKRLYLSTSDGKIEVQLKSKVWNPLCSTFRNQLSFLIKPERIAYNGQFYGKETLYLVDLQKNGIHDVIPINKKSKALSGFNLHSDESIQNYYQKLKEEGKIEFDEIKIVNFQNYITKMSDIRMSESISLPVVSPFAYLTHGVFKKTALLNKNSKGKFINKSFFKN